MIPLSDKGRKTFQLLLLSVFLWAAASATGSASAVAGGLGLAIKRQTAVSREPGRPAPLPKTSPSPFGVVLLSNADSQETLEQDLALIKGMGIKWIRIQPDWTRLQPERGTLDWSLTDRMVREARKQGLSILFTLGYTPRWASAYSDSNEPDVWNKNPPRDTDTWKKYVELLSRRYGHDVAHWQVWERTGVQFFRGSEKDVAALLRATAETTRKVNPKLAVALPEDGKINLSSINTVYVYGGLPDFGVLSLYPFFEKPEQMIRPLQTLETEILRERKPPKEIWFSGLGWNAQPVSGPLRDPVVSEDDQAKYLVRGVVLALSQGVGRIFWHTFRDHTEGPYQAQSGSGLVRTDGSERPAATAYRTLITLLEGKKYSCQASWGPHLYGYLFEGGPRSVLAAWSDKTAAKLPASPGISLTSVSDILGQKHDPGSGIELSDSPILIVAPKSELEKLLALRPDPPPADDPDYSNADKVTVILGQQAEEGGLHTERYHQLQSGTVKLKQYGGSYGWSTIVDEKKSSIFFDIDDTFLYFVNGHFEVEIEVDVYGNTTSRKMGFNIGYDSMKGFKFTPWQWVEPGDGWKTYTFRIHDADFSDTFSDFRLNALGSEEDVCVRSVKVRKRSWRSPYWRYLRSASAFPQ